MCSINYLVLLYLSVSLLSHSRVSQAFFSPSLENVRLDDSSSRIFCISQSSDGDIDISKARLCVIEEQQFDTEQQKIRWTHIDGLNWYLDIIQERECSGFISITPIGYGSCKALPYQENVRTSKLCICAASGCNKNMSQCVNSVDQSMASPLLPKPLPINMPVLKYQLACADLQNSQLGLSYFTCLKMSVLILGFNIAACNNYFRLHTVMCYSRYSNHINFAWKHALTIFEAGHELDIHLFQSVDKLSFQSYKQIFQSTTQVLIVVKNGATIQCDCYCITPNCNIDISTCTTGLNFDCIGSMTLTGMPTTTVIIETSTNQTSCHRPPVWKIPWLLNIIIFVIILILLLAGTICLFCLWRRKSTSNAPENGQMNDNRSNSDAYIALRPRTTTRKDIATSTTTIHRPAESVALINVSSPSSNEQNAQLHGISSQRPITEEHEQDNSDVDHQYDTMP